jgi:hypothetical protein
MVNLAITGGLVLEVLGAVTDLFYPISDWIYGRIHYYYGSRHVSRKGFYPPNANERLVINDFHYYFIKYYRNYLFYLLNSLSVCMKRLLLKCKGLTRNPSEITASSYYHSLPIFISFDRLVCSQNSLYFKIILV